MNAGRLALGHSLRALLEAHGIAVIAAVIFQEELGILIPAPGDLVRLLGGIPVAHGRDPLWLVLAVEEDATIVGASILFAGSYRFGRGIVLRFGWLLHPGPETLARAEGKVSRHGGRAIVFGRLIPGFRIGTDIAAGVLNLPYRTFGPALALGGFLCLLVYSLRGVFVGPAVLAFLERLALPATSLAASIAAGLAALLLANGGLGVASFVARDLWRAAPLSTVGIGDELRLLFGWPVCFVVAVVLGALYVLLGDAALPRLIRAALVAGVPLAATLLLIDPLVDDALVDLANATRATLAAPAVIR